MLADKKTESYFWYANAYDPAPAANQMGDRSHLLGWFDYLDYNGVRYELGRSCNGSQQEMGTHTSDAKQRY
jgi:hypothetical protein